MAICEMCGKDLPLFRAFIEGSELKVCKGCASFGKLIGPVAQPPKREKKKEKEDAAKNAEPEVIQSIVSGYGEIVKKARESKGLKQEELARKINEKESLIHKVETGHYEPNLLLAFKLEKFLGIKLVEETTVEKSGGKKPAESGGAFTIGDLIKEKK